MQQQYINTVQPEYNIGLALSMKFSVCVTIFNGYIIFLASSSWIYAAHNVNSHALQLISHT